MASSDTTDYARNGRLVDANTLCDGFLASCSSHGQDALSSFFGCELDEPGDVGVIEVLGVGSPFKVCTNVICLDAVKVIDLGKARGVGDKSECHKTVDGDKFSIVGISGKADFEISPTVYVGPHQLSGECLLSSIPSDDYATKSANAANVANFVKLNKLGDGDTSPFFDEHRVGPFARSAHSIASFSITQGV